MPVLYARIGGAWVPVGGGSGGGSEVHVGTSDPGVSYDLWYDTDEVVSLTDDARWNTAWGVIAVGTLNSMSGTSFTATTATDISSPLTVTLVSGRRYEMEACVHAIAGGASNNGFNLRFSGAGVAANDIWLTIVPNIWGSARHVALLTGSGSVTVTVQAQVLAGSVTLYTAGSAGSFFVVRDVGPVSGSVSAPNPIPPWTSLGLNANWTNRGGSLAPLQYRKIGDQVQLRGELTFTAGGANPVATLPVEYRPTYTQAFPVVNLSTAAVLYTVVYTDGTIHVFGLSGTTNFGLGNVAFT